MTDKKLPTINIKGKEYVMVKDRILAFNRDFPNGCIQTELVSPVELDKIVIKATVTPDITYPTRRFVDYSQATVGQGMINTTSALENASTSAVGRALAYMGIGVLDSVASADEVHKATSASTPIKSESTKWLDGQDDGERFTRESTECLHQNKQDKVASTTANFGKHFWSCPDCKNFLGWNTDPKFAVSAPVKPESD